jgi:hypothetical protein
MIHQPEFVANEAHVRRIKAVEEARQRSLEEELSELAERACQKADRLCKICDMKR